MPADLKESMIAAAKESGRSLHSEIISRLASSFEKPKAGGVDPVVVQLLADHQGILARLLRDVLEHIPKGMQNDQLFRVARDMANGIIHGDARAMLSAYAELVSNPEQRAKVEALKERVEREKLPPQPKRRMKFDR